MCALPGRPDLERVIMAEGRPENSHIGPLEKKIKTRWEEILQSARQEYLQMDGHTRFGVQVSIGFLEHKSLHVITRELVPDDDADTVQHMYYRSSSEQVEKLFSEPKSGIGTIHVIKVWHTSVAICFLTCAGAIDNDVSERLFVKHFPEVETESK